MGSIGSDIPKISSRSKFLSFEKGFIFDKFVMKFIEVDHGISHPHGSCKFLEYGTHAVESVSNKVLIWNWCSN